MTSTAAALLEGALKGGCAASGLPLGGFRVGQRADVLDLDTQSAPLLGLPPDHCLDGWVMRQPSMPVASIWVAGQRREPQPSDALRQGWQDVMKILWG